MAAVPKKKHTKSRTGKRRKNLLNLPNLIPCPKCGKPKLPHMVCPACGQY